MHALVTLFFACDLANGDSTRDTGGTCEVDPMELGLSSRPEAGACDPKRAPLEPVDARCGGGSEDSCSDHGDCTAGQGGRCLLSVISGSCGCQYDECESDDDCGATAACACGEVGTGRDMPNNRCVQAECWLDADCTSGLCLASVSSESCTPPSTYVNAYTCATEADTCRNDDACETCVAPGSRCLAEEGAGFSCTEVGQASCE